MTQPCPKSQRPRTPRWLTLEGFASLGDPRLRRMSPMNKRYASPIFGCAEPRTIRPPRASPRVCGAVTFPGRVFISRTASWSSNEAKVTWLRGISVAMLGPTPTAPAHPSPSRVRGAVPIVAAETWVRRPGTPGPGRRLGGGPFHPQERCLCSLPNPSCTRDIHGVCALNDWYGRPTPRLHLPACVGGLRDGEV
jgi:hypothetical protein